MKNWKLSNLKDLFPPKFRGSLPPEVAVEDWVMFKNLKLGSAETNANQNMSGPKARSYPEIGGAAGSGMKFLVLDSENAEELQERRLGTGTVY